MGKQLKLYQEILQGARDKDLRLYFINLSLLHFIVKIFARRLICILTVFILIIHLALAS